MARWWVLSQWGWWAVAVKWVGRATVVHWGSRAEALFRVGLSLDTHCHTRTLREIEKSVATFVN
jgi:hypothetical protein